MEASARRRLNPEDRRQEILDAAVRLFGERGYSDVSLSEIARAAGVTHALVHHYFGSKRDLYLAVLDMATKAAPVAFTSLHKGALRDRASADMDAWMDFVGTHRGLWLATAGQADVIADQEIADIDRATRERGIDRMFATYRDVIADTPTSRAALRGWLGFNRATLRQWIRDEIDRPLAHSLLVESLLAVMRKVIPAVDS
jgi:AcrR family transcriptional regulator